ncbi:transmembrane protein 136-like [Python bivittatus]|uniref:Transmembrane protein 136-like n=1 Tax=Python bivittatus TaxID=176946 RepID=A0A9F2NVG3_PYTBI|nr:transmembrane protein 136-like [Python bivittatus]
MASILLQVICGILAWLSLYAGFWCRNKHRSPEWSCRMVTFLHGLIVTFLSGYIILMDGPWPLAHAGHLNTPLQVFVICLSLGYFIFDFCWCILFISESDLMLSHHMLCMCGMTLALDTGKSGAEISAIIFVSEITNPLLQMRWFLRESGCYHSFTGDVVDFLFVILFLGLRIFGGAWIVHSVMNSPKTIVTLKGGILAMYAVSFIFMLDVLSFARRKTIKKYQAWRSERTREGHAKSNRHLPVS